MSQMNQVNRNCQMQRAACGANPQNSSQNCAQNCGQGYPQNYGQGGPQSYSQGYPQSRIQKNSALESMSQKQLLQHIHEVGFAVDDVLLYLDTHPCDGEALAYCGKMTSMRKEAVQAYSRRFGPLTVECAGENADGSWEWIAQPWPWETMSKGGCR